MQELFFELLRLYTGSQKTLSRDPSGAEWASLLKICKEQALIGLGFEAISKLPQDKLPPQKILFEWLAIADMVRKRNATLNDRCAELQERLAADGFRNITILKGQGNAVMYPTPLSRQSGDIDVWASTSKDEAEKYCRRFAKGELEIGLQHIPLEIFHDAEVELHFSIGSSCGLISGKIEKWFKQQLPCHAATACLPNGCSINVPDAMAGIVHQTSHLYQHFLDEGVGLRQILDYYMLLLKAKQEGIDFGQAERILKSLSLYKMSCAALYVIGQVLGVPTDAMPWKPNSGYGKLLMEKIMEGGNFGTHSANYSRASRKTLGAMWARAKMYLRNFIYLPYDPLMAFSCFPRIVNGFFKKTSQFFKGELK